MAWQQSLVMAVRTLVNDLGTTQTFDDDTIQRAIVIGGLIAAQEYPFTIEYTFDLITPDFSPDSTIQIDNEANALFILKAACMLNINSYQGDISSGGGVQIREGDSVVDTTGVSKGYSDILKNGPCASYQTMLTKLSFRQGSNLGRAVLTPYSSVGSSGDGWGIWNAREFFNSYFRFLW